MATGERRQQLVQAWEAAWDRGEVGALDALLSPDYRRHSRSSGQGQTLEEFKAMITSSRLAFPDLTTTIEEIVEADDRVAIRWTSRGTHTGYSLGVPPTRREVTVTGATFAHFHGDVITEEFVTWDPRELLSAMGIISLGDA